jgi:hypothetical protein
MISLRKVVERAAEIEDASSNSVWTRVVLFMKADICRASENRGQEQFRGAWRGHDLIKPYAWGALIIYCVGGVAQIFIEKLPNRAS